MKPVRIGERTPIYAHGVSRSWQRDIGENRFAFTVVNMSDGEVRLIVKIYNGYGDDGTAEGRAIGMRFSCAWTQYKWITLPPVRPTVSVRDWFRRANGLDD